MSGDTEQEFFADGLAEDIITALSKAHWLFVIARNSSFTYKGKSVDVRQLGRELGVRYVLEGSVRKSGNRVRITAQLIDATDGHQVWADRYDRALDDIFAVQDEITHSIIGAIAPGIVAAEIQRGHGKDVAELGQWERVMRAHWHVQRLSREDCIEAFRPDRRGLAARSKERYRRSPIWPTIGTWAASSAGPRNHCPKPWSAWGTRRAARSQPTIRTLWLTLRLRCMSCSRTDTTMQSGACIARLRSTRIRASRAAIWESHISFGGEPDRSLSALEEAMRLSPRDFLMVVWHTASAWSHLHAERFVEAVNCAKQAIEFNPAFPDSHGTLAASAAHLGHMADARAGLDVFVRLLPGLTLGDPRLIRPFRRTCGPRALSHRPAQGGAVGVRPR